MFRTYRTYYSFLLRYKWRFFLFLLAIIGSSLFQSVQPYFYKLFIDAISHNYQSAITFVLFGYILVRLGELIFDTASHWLSDTVVLPASRDARISVFRKIQDLDFAFHLSRSTGSLISAMKRGDNAFFDMMHAINIRLLSIFISFLVTLSFFFSLNPMLAGLMSVSLLVNLAFTKYLITNNIKARAEFNRSEDEISEIIVDNLINYETVKLFAREDHEYHRLRDRFIVWIQKLWGYANTFRLIDIVVGTVGNAGILAVLLLGLYQLQQQVITAADYIMVLGFVSSFYPRFFEMIYEFRNIAKHYTDIQKYFDILDEKTLVKDPRLPLKLTTITGDIEFKNVNFTYPEGKKGALKDINLHIRPGQSVAFVGSSGVGKTTLIKLLMRFYDPGKGRIMLDGHNIKKFTKQQLRSFMGVVPQEPILFNNTIAYNIAYGINDASEQEIVAAAKMANLDDFINNLPKKYETQVGERGVKLSGGQKQRLAIARMILSAPDVVIFDEATSQLDSESEKLIQDAFWKAVKNKTTLIIAHRLSTITRAEKIIVMERGRIKEIGSHNQLLADKNSLYSRFWSLQSQPSTA